MRSEEFILKAQISESTAQVSSVDFTLSIACFIVQ